MDLRNKLRQFEPIANLPSQKPKKVYLKQQHQDHPGEVVANDFGTCLRIRTSYPVNHAHGKIILKTFHEIDQPIFGMMGKDPSFNHIDFNRAIFLDTETTGLAGGAGTVPFLVGLGYFRDKNFVIDQYLMRDYHEERAMLSFVSDHIQSAGALVTYNGKGYDAHVLSSRWILARMAVDIHFMPHLDLLYPVRRLWKRRLIDCSLGNVEKEILQFQRHGDVPGYLIPSLFFDFLRTSNYHTLNPIFTHNRWDILSLVALAGLMGTVFQNPLETLSHPADVFSLGRAMENSTKGMAAIQCFQKALSTVQRDDNWQEIAWHLGRVYKREENWNEAIKIWKSILERSPDKIETYEEMAKYYEHQIKQFDKAIAIVTRALERIQIVQELRGDFSHIFWKEKLEYRLKRLEHKMGKQGSRE